MFTITNLFINYFQVKDLNETINDRDAALRNINEKVFNANNNYNYYNICKLLLIGMTQIHTCKCTCTCTY